MAACAGAMAWPLLLPEPAGAATCAPAEPASCSLRSVADLAKLRIGSTITSSRLGDPAYAGLLSEQFSSLTPENDLKWYSVQPAPGEWHFEAADADLAFAEAHGMALKGHNLIWDQDAYTPAWVRALGPSGLRSAVDEEIRTVVGRYRGRIPRWDVVNEPLANLGTARSDSVFERELGKGWMVRAFVAAHEADPAAELWLNEYGTDWVPGKTAALVRLVRGLREQGAPIYGVGLELHRPTDRGPRSDDVVAALSRFARLGLRTAITELDVPIAPGDPAGPRRQAKAYGRVVQACLEQPRCREVTVWGLDDGHSWLDHLGLFPTPTRPLLFDADLQPKPAFAVVRACIARAALLRAGAPAAPLSCASLPRP